MEREKRSLYDKNSNLTEKFYFKGDKIPENYYPMVVMVAIQNSKGEFLMQKRVESKGGDWGIIVLHTSATVREATYLLCLCYGIANSQRSHNGKCKNNLFHFYKF